MKVAIIGASGLLGNNIFRTLEATGVDTVGTSFSQISSGLVRLDATDSYAVSEFLNKEHPDLVVLAAGTKDINSCEKNWSMAEKLNVVPVRNIVSHLSENQRSCRLVLISTDYVFEGITGNYRDTDLPNPRTNYGRSKFMAETLMLSSRLPCKVVRTAAVMGRGSRFFDWLMEQFEQSSRIEAYDNVRFSPYSLGFVQPRNAPIDRGFRQYRREGDSHCRSRRNVQISICSHAQGNCI